jgi:GR25 family glycosyltransferase involved in LPS biosynthesis
MDAKKIDKMKHIILNKEKWQEQSAQEQSAQEQSAQEQSAQEQSSHVEIIDLFATVYISNIAEALTQLLREMGIEVNVYIRDLTNEDIYKCSSEANRYLFICCPQHFLQLYGGLTYPDKLNLLPVNKYFIYQLEKLDIGSPVYLSKNIISIIKKSRSTFDYSEINLPFYPDDCKEKVIHLLPPLVEWSAVTNGSVKKIDILFCGRKTDQRDNICQELRMEGYNALYVTDVFGKTLTELIKKSRIFLNLHHDQSSSLETSRLNEAVMSPDIHIISEKSDQPELEKMYEGRIHFIERISGESYVELIDKVKELLDTKEIGEFNKEEWNERIMCSFRVSKFKFNISIYNSIIEGKQQFDNDTFTFMKDKSYCNLEVKELVDLPIYYINLDKSTDRFNMFNSQINKYNIPQEQVKRISAIDGKTLDIASIPNKIHNNIIKNPNVISCTLSHIKAIQTAYEDLCEYAIIMEDDCNFKYVPYQRYKLSDIANFLGKKYNVIQLSHINTESYNSTLQLSPLFILPGYKDSTAAYIITRAGMKNVLDAFANINTQLYVADITIYELARKTCHVTKPYFIYFDSQVINTTIHLNSTLEYENKNKLFWDKYYYVVSQYWEKAYVINLDMDVKKYINMCKLLNILNLDYNSTFVSAELGTILDIPTLKQLNILTEEFSKFYKGTIGCNYTQYKIIKEAYEKNYNKIIIFEDDISLTDKFFETLYNSKLIENDGFILGHEDWHCTNTFSKIHNNCYKINNKDYFVGGFFAVILNKKSIDYFYNNWNPIHTISDIYLRNIACHLNIYYIIPVIINVDTNKQSLTFLNDIISGIKHTNKTICNTLEKIKRIMFKNEYNILPISIYIFKLAKEYSIQVIERILKTLAFNNIQYTDNIEEADIIFIHYCERIHLQAPGLSILINGESMNDLDLNFDIYIDSIKPINYFHIHYPEIFQSSMDKFDTTFPLKKKTKFCAYMYSYDIPHRVNYFKLLSTYKLVDGLGKSMNNVNRENDRFNKNFKDVAIRLYSDYKFVLALENVNCDGYSTEKLLLPLYSNTIPIYYGHSGIFKYINKKRVIFTDDFKSDIELLEYIKKVDMDDVLYNKIIQEEWFTKNNTFETITTRMLDDRIKNIFGLTQRNISITKNCNTDVLYFNYNYTIFNKFFIKKSLLNWCNEEDNFDTYSFADLK